MGAHDAGIKPLALKTYNFNLRIREKKKLHPYYFIFNVHN